MDIAVIVEGHGESEAVPVLLRRLIGEAERWDVQVRRPIRGKRNRLTNPNFEDLERAVQLAAGNPDVCGVLILVDADGECPAHLGPQLANRAAVTAAGRATTAAVVAKEEYEAWFLTGGAGISDNASIRDEAEFPPHPESIRNAKAHFKSLMKSGHHYSETLDQPSFSNAIDLLLARERSPSFDKFCREVERLLSACPEAE